ncbi:unnamed protein product, partial [Iphiclides podalirius]
MGLGPIMEASGRVLIMARQRAIRLARAERMTPDPAASRCGGVWRESQATSLRRPRVIPATPNTTLGCRPSHVNQDIGQISSPHDNLDCCPHTLSRSD